VSTVPSDRPYRVPVEPVDLFAYGTLQFPEVLRVLLGRAPIVSAASVAGWRIAALPGQVYPALVPASSATLASGQLISDLSPAEWRILDAFETDIYDLRRITLTEGRAAWAYVCLDSVKVLASDWDMLSFERDHFATYLKACAAWSRKAMESK
jgi:gamma-glutamylcyclotransferase (GGCT)/AIG2-like uncharacterized protein YtfP